jgi:hypothetical protein
LLLVRRASDATVTRWLDRLIGWLTRRNPDDFNIVVLGDARKIFADPKSAQLARRMVLEARPAQLRAVVRGAIR